MDIPTRFSLTIHHLVQRQWALDWLALERIVLRKYNPMKPFIDARITEMIQVIEKMKNLQISGGRNSFNIDIEKSR